MNHPESRSFPHRIWIYQKERFPVFVHLPLITAFSFSAIGFSRLCRGYTDFIDGWNFLACVFTNIAVFFILRVSDEHKDKDDDAAYRSYLPVPRGLISLKELRSIAIVLFAVATIINVIYFPELLYLYLALIVYLTLMRYEFFCANWLKQHQVWYIISHMIIIPLADVYSSSYDWQLNQVSPSRGLLFFFAVSFLNGIVLEIGRKIRQPSDEESGVLSYTKLWGRITATVVWMAVVSANFLLACIAARYAGLTQGSFIVLGFFFSASIVAAIAFIIKASQKKTKFIELMSLLWAMAMYLTLGGIPTLIKLFS